MTAQNTKSCTVISLLTLLTTCGAIVGIVWGQIGECIASVPIYILIKGRAGNLGVLPRAVVIYTEMHRTISTGY